MTAAWTPPRPMVPECLLPGDRVLVVPAALDAEVAWVAPSEMPLVAPEGGMRWATVLDADPVDEDGMVAVRLDAEDGGGWFVLNLEAMFGQVQARFPCEATP